MNNIIAIIPARSGSKSVKDKNIAQLGGHPLIAYSIAVAKLSGLVERVVVFKEQLDWVWKYIATIK